VAVPLEKDQQLREEFNRWAEDGRGAGMEEDHLPIVAPALELMQIQPGDNVLDVGCGTGWLSRLLAARAPHGRIVGMDVSDEMVRLARRQCLQIENALFIEGSVEAIPWEDNFFQKVISVESAYYWPDPARGLREIFRALAEGGSAWVLINYYRDNPHCHQWAQHYAIPTHLLSAAEWAQLFRDAGFAAVAHRRIPDPSPAPEVYTGRWFRDAAQLRAFKAAGALLVHGTVAATPGVTSKVPDCPKGNNHV
jgi:ubiquinone/menaquinone biosynthesis C-methylase UbiE